MSSLHRVPALGALLYRAPALGALLSGTNWKLIAAIFAAGLCVGLGASWLLSTPATSPSPPQSSTQDLASPPSSSALASPESDDSNKSAEQTADDPCERQTWPYVDDKCRNRASTGRTVRVITTDRSAPAQVVTAPAPPPESRPVEPAQAARQAEAPVPEGAREQPAASVQSNQAVTTDAQQAGRTDNAAAPSSSTASVPPPNAQPIAAGDQSEPSQTRSDLRDTARMDSGRSDRRRSRRADRRRDRQPPQAPMAEGQQTVATTTGAAPSASGANVQPATTGAAVSADQMQQTPPQVDANTNTAEAEQNGRSKRSRRAERRNRAARTQNRPQSDDSGTSGRTYNLEDGGRVTIYQRGNQIQVGDRVDFGDSPTRRRGSSAPAERSRRDANDAPVAERSRRANEGGGLSSEPIVSRGSADFFFAR